MGSGTPLHGPFILMIVSFRTISLKVSNRRARPMGMTSTSQCQKRLTDAVRNAASHIEKCVSGGTRNAEAKRTKSSVREVVVKPTYRHEPEERRAMKGDSCKIRLPVDNEERRSFCESADRF
jgi:hypothetical protein